LGKDNCLIRTVNCERATPRHLLTSFTGLPDVALQELELDVGDAVLLIDKFAATPAALSYRKSLKLRIE
jgi:hypothetical protein